MVSPTKMSRVQTSTLTITIKLYIYIYIDKGVFGEAKPMKDDGTNRTVGPIRTDGASNDDTTIKANERVSPMNQQKMLKQRRTIDRRRGKPMGPT